MATNSALRTRKSARDRLEQALDRIAEPAGEGARACLTIYPATACAEADAADRRARDGAMLGPLDGAIVSIKDLFDVAGEPTRAGSTVLAGAPPADADAPVVRRLREAGAVIVAKTSMSEFAFTGVGMNPHYGTPGNPADRTRVPGGSSSGAAVACADGMCEIAIGTDTGGSTRIPAAQCGVVGFKPTKARVPTDGAYPLSPTLDSIGPIAMSVEACARADAVLAGEAPWALEPPSLDGLRIGILQGEPLSELDDIVTSRFDDAIALLGQTGARLADANFPTLEDMARVNRIATIATAEAYQIHKTQLATRGDDYDQFIRRRIEGGSAVSSADYARMIEERSRLARAMDLRMSAFDALVLPTTPIVAPITAKLESEHQFQNANRLLLRNAAIANFFDLCALSLPIPGNGLPVGLMLFARHGQDRQLFRAAAAVEALFKRA
jgi:aspartyl-tRNA(Asn)/glutamyl-tRNA(Gln) amidotransferase subunit A